jgi:hypothetical protein
LHLLVASRRCGISAQPRTPITGVMDADEITFEDLLAGEPEGTAPARTFARLLAEGFPRGGGLAELAAIMQLEEPGPRFAAVRLGYLQIFATQHRPSESRS